MSYPLTTPTPTGLAPLNHVINAVEVAQLVENTGPALRNHPDVSTLDAIAITSSVTATPTITIKHGPKGPQKH
jgi:hypothetical protein